MKMKKMMMTKMKKMKMKMTNRIGMSEKTKGEKKPKNGKKNTETKMSGKTNGRIRTGKKNGMRRMTKTWMNSLMMWQIPLRPSLRIIEMMMTMRILMKYLKRLRTKCKTK